MMLTILLILLVSATVSLLIILMDKYVVNVFLVVLPVMMEIPVLLVMLQIIGLKILLQINVCVLIIVFTRILINVFLAQQSTTVSSAPQAQTA